MQKAEGRPAWRNLDPERRERIAEQVRYLLRMWKRQRSEAGAIVAKLEKWAAFHKRRPGEQGSDTEIHSRFPLEVCNSARALARVLKRQPRGTLGYLFSPASLCNKFWAADFDLETWRAFWLILGSLADSALKNRRPLDLRLRSLEERTLSVLKAEGPFGCTNHYVADILAEIKADAMGTPFPRQAAARVKALRDAVRRLEGWTAP